MSAGPGRRHWTAALAAVLVVGSVLALAVALTGALLSDVTHTDRFRVIDVISDGSLRRHAVVYRHDHAETGRSLTGAWIIDGDPPERGGRERPIGVPVAVWTSGIARLGWRGGRLSLVGSEAAGSPAPPSVDACYTNAPPRLCLDPGRVTLVAIPR